MVLEVALIRVTDPQAFVAAYLGARHIPASTPGFRSMRLTSGVESPDRFVLLVEWDSVEAHIDGFRGSDRFPRWRAAIGSYFAEEPDVEHFLDVG